MKRKFIYFIGLALLGTVYSCKKSELYPVSQTQVSNQAGQPFSTPARILANVEGLYTSMRSGQQYGGRYQIYNEVKADNWINATANSVTAYQTWTETVSSTSSEVLNLWYYSYYTINNCNLFIDGMNATGTATLNNTTLANNYIGEAKFIRAASYFDLLNMYCQPYAVSAGTSPGLPMRLTGLSAYGTYDLAPVNVAAVFTQILKDLDDAEAALPASYGDATTNTTRAHKNTAIAFKTRVYLAQGNWAKVISEAQKIVSGTTSFTATNGGVAFALQPNPATPFKTYTTTESILSMPYNANEVPNSQNALGDYIGGGSAQEFYLNTTNGVYNDPNWKSTDLRKTTLLQTIKSKIYTAKYPTASPGFIDWVPVMRYPEVLLNYAEALARNSGTVDPTAVALLNAVRQRSDPSTVYTVASFADATALENAILEERNIEFLGEGLRWFDLWRLDLTIPAKGTVPAVAPTSSSYIWPMSGNEQLTNHLIGR